MRKFFLLVLVVFLIYGTYCSAADAATYYVRTDGGTSAQCTGLADAAYDGSGTGESCAWIHPAYAMPLDGGSPFTSGDILIIKSGTYDVGYNVVHIRNTSSGCTGVAASRFGCIMGRIPANATVLGEGYESCENTAISSMNVTLRAQNRQHYVLALSDNSVAQCLDITDDDECAQDGPNSTGGGDQNQCDWDCGDGSCEGSTALVDLASADGFTLQDMYIHGSYKGVYGAYAGNGTLTNVRIFGNTWQGFGNDAWFSLNGDDFGENVTGTWNLDKVKVVYNGCGEVVPRVSDDIYDTANYHNCFSQSQGGFGDGWGTDGGDNASWNVTDSDFSYNTSDGWDGLYSSSCSNCDFTARRVRALGNAGQTFKLNGRRNTLIENSILSSNCSYFQGQSWTATTARTNWESGCNSILGTWDGSQCLQSFNNCRGALGQVVNSVPGGSVKFYGNTVYSEFDAVDASSGGSSVTWEIENSIYRAATQFGGGDQPVLFYCEGSGCGVTRSYGAENIFYNLKNSECPGGSTCSDPLFNDATNLDDVTAGHIYDFTLASGSPARNLADETVNQTAVDNNNWARGASWDSGAFEYDTAGGSDPCDTDCTQCSSSASCAASALGTCDYWQSTSSCQATTETCSDWYQECLTQSTCESAGNYWYDAQCNATPQGCETNCASCTTSASCSSSAERCSYIDSTCRDISLITTTGSSPNWTFTGEDYAITSTGGDRWINLLFPNADSSTTDVLLGQKFFSRILGGGVYTVPNTSMSGLDIDSSVVVQYSHTSDMVGSSTTYGTVTYYASFFRDRVVTRVEVQETVDSGNSTIRFAWDEDLRETAGGSTLVYNDEYRYKESGGAWATETIDGTEPSGGTILLPAAKQTRFDTGATDGVWAQIATDLSSTNFATATIEEEVNYDDVSLYVSPPVTSTQYANTVVHLFYAGNAYQDTDVGEYYSDWGTPATLSADTGTINTSATGDTDTDGFNERYGWYEVTADASGVAKVDVPNDGITRKSPVFKFSSAILDDYDVKINGTTLTEGVDYIMTTEADEADTGIGTDVRIVQLLADYSTGITDLEIAAAATCASDSAYCLTEGACTGASWFWYNSQCNATAEETAADKAALTGGCGLSGNATLK